MRKKLEQLKLKKQKYLSLCRFIKIQNTSLITEYINELWASLEEKHRRWIIKFMLKYRIEYTVERRR